MILTWGRSECGIRGVASVDHVTAPQCHSNRSYKTCSMPNNFIRRPKSSHELTLFSVQILYENNLLMKPRGWYVGIEKLAVIIFFFFDILLVI